MLPSSRRVAAAATAGLLLSVAAVVPASAAPGAQAIPAAAPGGKNYTGYSNGTLEFVNALNLPAAGGPDVARVGLGQSAAGVQVPGPLSTAATFDQLKQPLLIAEKGGKTAYGHGAGVNIGLLSANASVPPNLSETLAEATSPAPSSDKGSLADVPASPVATAQVLPSSAVANTTADGACVLGKDLSNGQASIANARALITSPTTPLVTVDDVSESFSRERLIKQINAAGATVGTGTGLLSQTTQNLAPITLFKGTPAQLTIDVLAPITLTASAGGIPGTAVVSYGASGVSDERPILRISGGGETETLNSSDVFGDGGFVIPLGVADITIGSPAHSLTGLERSAPTRAANGTLASAAADFIRISVPGRLNTPGSNPLDGPLAPLNAVLNPVLDGLDPILSEIQDALKEEGLDAADLRIGHLEAFSQVPVGGIDCSVEDPLRGARKDVSATHVTAGQTFDYTIRVPNLGSEPITDVRVTDTFTPASLQFVSSVPAPASRDGNVLKYSLGTIQPGDIKTIVMTFRVPPNADPGTEYRNRATITGTYLGQRIDKDVAANGPTVIGTLTGDCNLSGSRKYASSSHVRNGENFGYFVNVFNSGGTACRDVVVRDTLISGVRFVSCNRSCDNSGQLVTWRLGTIQPGQSLVLRVTVKVRATAGRLPNTAIITTDNGTGGRPKTPGPIVGRVSITIPGVPAVLVRDNGGQLPRTGLATGVTAAGLLLLLGSAVAVRRRKALG